MNLPVSYDDVVEKNRRYHNFGDKLEVGRPKKSLRLILRAIFYVLKEGVSWRAIDSEEIPWQTAYGSFRRWSKLRIWEKICNQLSWKKGDGSRFVDSTHVKVHKDGANPAGGQEDAGNGSHQRGGSIPKFMQLPIVSDNPCP